MIPGSGELFESHPPHKTAAHGLRWSRLSWPMVIQSHRHPTGTVRGRAQTMARPPLAMGTYGSITIKKRSAAGGSESNGTASYVACCRFRDYDGVTRSLERSGPSVEGRCLPRPAGRDPGPYRQPGRAVACAPHLRARRAALAGEPVAFAGGWRSSSTDLTVDGMVRCRPG